MNNYDIKLEQKEKALSVLKELNVFKDFRDALKDKDWITMFEYGIGYWSFQYEDLTNKIKEIENKYGVYVYAITHEYLEFGEIYDLLVIPKDKSEWNMIIDKLDNKQYYAFAYCWNKTDDNCSEFGDIVVKERFGGLVRTY